MARYQALDPQRSTSDIKEDADSSSLPAQRSSRAPHPYYDDPSGKPLFGDATPSDRVLNLIVGAFTALFVTITLICAVAFPWPPKGVNIYFALCIVLICGSHLVLIFWYRQGDLEPRFRTLIFYNAFTIILLCICANLYIHNVG